MEQLRWLQETLRKAVPERRTLLALVDTLPHYLECVTREQSVPAGEAADRAQHLTLLRMRMHREALPAAAAAAELDRLIGEWLAAAPVPPVPRTPTSRL
ncbi:hypothetical protein [Hymenobacter latericus]|uniref:hypothetical protein n=1 Tax=Hymenobacter sp. YIM 151858-1 TaxID=2987688 RepID=UPI0022277A13|nr:hypothetical protein [Hymenobacter sp. YIM 151858-1]UYZ61166.1 hypothetical protein OIS50_19545 [Hymenobacter sp. YIM 151858-1]